MSVKEIDNENLTKVNATRGNVYTVHTKKLIEHVNQLHQEWEKKKG